MHSRPYHGPQSEIIRREPLFLIRGSGEAHFCATCLAHVKGLRGDLANKIHPGTGPAKQIFYMWSDRRVEDRLEII